MKKNIKPGNWGVSLNAAAPKAVESENGKKPTETNRARIETKIAEIKAKLNKIKK